MQMTQVKESLDRIEQCTDQAVAVMRQSSGQTPDELRRCVDEMHSQARQVRQMAQQQSGSQSGQQQSAQQPSGGEGQLASQIDQLEQTGDRAKQVCQSAGNAVDPQLQSAVMEAHDQISNLKKQLH